MPIVYVGYFLTPLLSTLSGSLWLFLLMHFDDEINSPTQPADSKNVQSIPKSLEYVTTDLLEETHL